MKLHHTVSAAIKAHAVAEYPKESCGVIAGGVYRPCENVAEEPTKDFRIAPNVFTNNGTGVLQVQAVVHSHPNGMPAPSAADMRSQDRNPAVPWGIVAVNAAGETSEVVFFGDCLPIPPLTKRPFLHAVADCYTAIRDAYRLGATGVADPLMWPDGKPVLDWPFQPTTLPMGYRDAEWWTKGGDLYEENFASAGFVEVNRNDVRVGDVLLFSIMPIGWTGKNITNHGGVYVGHGLMLHHLWTDPRRGVQRVSRREPVGPWMKSFRMALRYSK